MTVVRSAAEVLSGPVALELECLDRLYSNACVPMLQSGVGASYFFREIRGNRVPSSALMAPMTRSLVASIERFVRDEGLEMVRFSRGERKDEHTWERLRHWMVARGCCMSARRRSVPGLCARSAGRVRRAVPGIRGWFRAPPW